MEILTIKPEEAALAHIDTLRTFMPEEEGDRLGLAGFGELPVPQGQEIVPTLNGLVKVCRAINIPILDVGEAHPKDTAHFKKNGGMWDEHGVAGTPGAELHPELTIAREPYLSTSFKKGFKELKVGDPDDSYTGWLGVNLETGETVPHYLKRNRIRTVILGGLALGNGDDRRFCVDSTAIDLQNNGYRVILALDATRPIFAEDQPKAIKNLGAIGVRIATSAEITAAIEAAVED